MINEYMTPEQNDKTMPKRYKSNEYPIHFVTTNVMNNIFLLNHEEYCQIIVDNLKFYRDKYKLKIYAWVIIPWHIHLLLELPEGMRIQDVIRDFKGFCAKQLVERLKVDRRYDLLEKFCIAPTRGLAGTLASVNPPRSPALAGERSGGRYWWQ